MKKLMKNKKGFTLMEMLIVIAIIVILVAIAVPTFTTQLGKANEAADAANLRAAKAQASVEYLSQELAAGIYYFDASDNSLETEANKSSITAYGKQTGHSIVKVVIGDDGSITATWE